MSDVNSYSGRSIYPTWSGATVATDVTGAKTNMQGGSVPNRDSVTDPVSRAQMIGGQGSAVIAGIVLFGLLFGLMFLAKRLGTDDDFKSIKPTIYNVLTISLAAAVGLPLWKFAVTRFPVPGVSTWILAG